MKILDKLSGGLLNGVGNIISQFKLSPAERKKFETQMQALVADQARIVEESYQAEIEAKQAVMVAELESGDKFTSRTRPWIVRAGMGIIIVNHCVAPWLTFAIGHGAALLGRGDMADFVLPAITMPPEFWFAWGGVTGTYVVGRTAEKSGAAGKLVSMITGHKK